MTASVSVVIPAHQAAAFIDDAVQSIRAQSPRVELIVVDDASTDITAEVARRAGADHVLRLAANVGPAAARNRGVAVSSGDLVGFLDADDRWIPGRLQLMLSALNPAVDVVIGATRFVDLRSEELARYRFAGTDHVAVVPKLCSALVRRTAFDSVGPFNENLRNYEDYEWFLRAAEAGLGFSTLPTPVTEYRRRIDSLSQAAPPDTSAILRLLKSSLDRRRSSGGALDEGPRWGALQ